ncbi:MAG: hypothetical protein OHK0018_07150 [Erythrobacter tepidarius]
MYPRDSRIAEQAGNSAATPITITARAPARRRRYSGFILAICVKLYPSRVSVRGKRACHLSWVLRFKGLGTSLQRTICAPRWSSGLEPRLNASALDAFA